MHGTWPSKQAHDVSHAHTERPAKESALPWHPWKHRNPPHRCDSSIRPCLPRTGRCRPTNPLPGRSSLVGDWSSPTGFFDWSRIRRSQRKNLVRPPSSSSQGILPRVLVAEAVRCGAVCGVTTVQPADPNPETWTLLDSLGNFLSCRTNFATNQVGAGRSCAVAIEPCCAWHRTAIQRLAVV